MKGFEGFLEAPMKGEEGQKLFKLPVLQEGVKENVFRGETSLGCGHTFQGLESFYIGEVLHYICGACRVAREVIEQRVFLAARSPRDEARLRNEVYRTHVVEKDESPNLCVTGFSCLCAMLHQNCKWCIKGRYKKCVCGNLEFNKVTVDYFLIVKDISGGHKVIDHVLYLREKREHVYFKGSFPACSRFIDKAVRMLAP